jgi:hypothetical protein
VELRLQSRVISSKIRYHSRSFEAIHSQTTPRRFSTHKNITSFSLLSSSRTLDRNSVRCDDGATEKLSRCTEPSINAFTAKDRDRHQCLRPAPGMLLYTPQLLHLIDLLRQPGKIASILWTVGVSLLHSGVVINGREYAYGGHDQRGVTGVYWTKPRTEPPGGTFKSEILHGFTVRPQEEIEAILKEASEAFPGTSYNLLNKNCNHFTQYLCEKLTGRSGPAWLNRAASIGVALPCVVPRDWIAPPDFETAEGELMDDDEHIEANERSGMLSDMDSSHRRSSSDRRAGSRMSEVPELDSGDEREPDGAGKGKAPIRDTSGRMVPPSERAPVRGNR